MTKEVKRNKYKMNLSMEQSNHCGMHMKASFNRVGDGTLKLYQEGEYLGEFNANSFNDKVINIPGGGGKVDDVTVNGVSVVDGKVAKVDLTSYLKTADIDGGDSNSDYSPDQKIDGGYSDGL